MRVLFVCLLLAGAFAGLAAPAAAEDMCVAPSGAELCPPGSIPWRRSGHGCGWAAFECAYLW